MQFLKTDSHVEASAQGVQISGDRFKPQVDRAGDVRVSISAAQYSEMYVSDTFLFNTCCR